MIISILSAILAAFMAFFTGCEDNSKPYEYNAVPSVGQLKIEPSSAELAVTETFAVFTASGGVGPYSWAVSDKTLGTVPATTGNTITYTRTAATFGANLIIVADNNGWSAQAVVMQSASTNATGASL